METLLIVTNCLIGFGVFLICLLVALYVAKFLFSCAMSMFR